MISLKINTFAAHLSEMRYSRSSKTKDYEKGLPLGKPFS